MHCGAYICRLDLEIERMEWAKLTVVNLFVGFKVREEEGLHCK